MKFHQYSWTRRSLFRGLKWEIKLGAAALTDGELDNCDGGGKSVNLYRQMTFMPLSGALDEEAAESASVTACVWKRLLFTVKRAGSQYASWLNQVGRLQLWKKFVCVCGGRGTCSCLQITTELPKNKGSLREQTREWIVFFSPTAKAVSVWLNNLPNAVEGIPRYISEPVTLMDWAIKSLSKGGRATLRLKITSLLLVD